MSDIQQLLPTNFIIQKNYAGYLQKMGRTAGTIYNKYALVSDKDTNEKFYVIYCYPNNITYVSKNDINKAKKMGLAGVSIDNFTLHSEYSIAGVR